ncbi:hypothetical protein B0T26DRAFT_483193 [Lasiosphaeria miniovina]|uniref:Uncharacterized protein n=1 Tax=Lasiosphaeria miniovina TaxID=1954250 RepID=A0AA40DMV9_9PEZI|nr:uncharacterized protein B0T26DRAFT_483193 [Lasiosphaeria miniovina]KAK0707046.1 hypothetical protein B0T26DRAFT_483193 [Lasiosphaeria miniovina]
MTAPHHLFCTMVSNIRYRQPTSKPDDTEAYTFGHALGPFGQPQIKYCYMDNSLNPQIPPPKLKLGPAGPRRGLALFQEQTATRPSHLFTASPVWLLPVALDETEFWFQLARVTADWLEYISDQTSPVLPWDNNTNTSLLLPLCPDCFLQIYEYGPFDTYNQLHLKTVAIAIVSLVVHEIGNSGDFSNALAWDSIPAPWPFRSLYPTSKGSRSLPHHLKRPLCTEPRRAMPSPACPTTCLAAVGDQELGFTPSPLRDPFLVPCAKFWSRRAARRVP